MVFVLSFILEFISLFVTLFRSFSLTNINIPFIENSTILKHSSAFFASFFTRNITHFISHFIKLSQQEKAKTQSFWAAIDDELRGKRSGYKRRKELFLSVFRGRKGKEKRKRRGQKEKQVKTKQQTDWEQERRLYKRNKKKKDFSMRTALRSPHNEYN